MGTWRELVEARPDIGAAGQALLYQFGVGLAFLATVRRDGGPRVHPVCPLLDGDRLFAFVIPSPKQDDLRRDGRFSLHSFPCADNEDAIYLTGRARVVEDPATRERLGAQFVQERSQFAAEPPAEADVLFELGIDSCLLTRTTGHGDPSPNHVVWGPPPSA